DHLVAAPADRLARVPGPASPGGDGTHRGGPLRPGPRASGPTPGGPRGVRSALLRGRDPQGGGGGPGSHPAAPEGGGSEGRGRGRPAIRGAEGRRGGEPGRERRGTGAG